MTTEEIKKRLNFSRVLRAIWINNGISRIEIAKNIKVDKSTVSNIVSILLKMGIVVEVEEGQAGPQGGRKPIFLKLNENFGYFVGIEIQCNYYTVSVVNLEGVSILSDSGAVSVDASTLEEVILKLYGKFKKVLDARNIPVIGVGVGCPGVINAIDGEIKYSMRLKVSEKLSIARNLSSKIDVPIFLENDANCCSWGELSRNKSERLKNFIFVLGTSHKKPNDKCEKTNIGIGLGIVINGKVHHGLDFSGGEFRSVFWKDTDPNPFNIGNQLNEESLQDDCSLDKTTELAKNVALLVNTLNLTHVFLGGFLDSYDEEILEVFYNTIQDNWPYPSKVDCPVRFCSMGKEAVAYGAAAMLLERLFAIPEIPETTERNIRKWFVLIDRIHELSKTDSSTEDVKVSVSLR